MAVYDITQTIPDKIKKGDILNCPYSGAAISITLPKGLYKLECWGAQGGSYNASKIGGKGGYSYGELNLTKPETLYLYSGGQGAIASGSKTVVAGGWNGGGSAYSNNSSINSGSGGGGSDIRINGTSLYSRVIVAGGGGGYSRFNTSTSYSYNGGAGGGISGITGLERNTSYKAGTGGSQTAGGTSYYGTNANNTSYGINSGFGIGGSGTSSTTTYGAGGGGGGWYGGGYGRRSSGGGGSGYVYDATNSANYPSGCLLNANCYLSNCNTINGASSFIDYSGATVTGHEGNGCCRITVIDIQSVDNIYIKIGNEWKKPIKVFYKEGNTEKELPKEYQEVEYIESAGTQWIDTGLIINENFSYETLDERAAANENSVLGVNPLIAFTNTDTKRRIRYNSDAYDYGNKMTKTKTYLYKNKLYSNDELIYTFGQATFISNYTLILFGRRSNDNGDIQELMNGKLYYCKIWNDNDELVRNFIPCYRKSDNIIGLYDLVNDVFYTNQGSGTFIKGNNILPNTYQEVEYIKSNGTQYIDTGINKTTPQTEIEMDFEIVESKDFQALYCSRINAMPQSRTLFITALNGFRNDANAQRTVSKTLSLGRKYNLKSTKTNLILDDVVIDTYNLTETINDRKLTLLNSYDTDTQIMSDRYGTIIKLYGCKIWENDIIVRNFIPCYRKSDNVIGLYDLINNVFYTNQGSGKFSMGTPILHDGEFAEVEYLESSGSQYIDTDFIANNNTKVEIKINTNTNEKWLFGGRQTTTSNIYGVFLNSVTNGDIWFQYGTNGTTYVTGTNISNQPTTIITDKNKWYLNGVLEQALTASTFTTPVTMKICTVDTAGALDDRKFIGKIYYFKIWDNNQLIRDLKPCVDHNLIPCLYDTISKKAFYNAGTGNFTVGGLTGTIYPIREKGWIEISNNLSLKINSKWTGVEDPEEQLINYTMLYDAGDECLDITDGWNYHRLINSSDSKDIDFSSYTFTKNSSNIYVKGVHNSNKNSRASIYTAQPIELTGYSKILYKTSSNDHGPATQVLSALLSQNPTNWSDATSLGGIYTTNSSSSTLITNKPLYLANINYLDSKSVGLLLTSDGWYGDVSFYLYNVILLRLDNWQKLCTIAGLTPSSYTDENDLCNNASAITIILDNQKAVNYMIKKCTGSFMGTFIASSTALSALDNSAYKNTILANIHWAKFLAMAQ